MRELWRDRRTRLEDLLMGGSFRASRSGYDLQLTRYDERGWRATFYVTGIEHSPTGATGSAWEPTPWRVVQAVAREALRKAE
jgi:hypothetical protein